MDSLILSRLLKVTAVAFDAWLVIESCDTLLLNLTPCTAGLLYGNLHGELGGGGSSSKPRLSEPVSFVWLLTSSSFFDDSRLQRMIARERAPPPRKCRVRSDSRRGGRGIGAKESTTGADVTVNGCGQNACLRFFFVLCFFQID